jgi:hypothetical protein
MAGTAENSPSLWSSREILIFQSVLQTPLLVDIIQDRFKKVSKDFMLFIEDQLYLVAHVTAFSRPWSYCGLIPLFTFIGV